MTDTHWPEHYRVRAERPAWSSAILAVSRILPRAGRVSRRGWSWTWAEDGHKALEEPHHSHLFEVVARCLAGVG